MLDAKGLIVDTQESQHYGEPLSRSRSRYSLSSRITPTNCRISKQLEDPEFYKACHFRTLEDQVCSLTIGDDKRWENRAAQESLSVDRRYSKLLAKHIELLQAHPTSIALTHEAGNLAETHMVSPFWHDALSGILECWLDCRFGSCRPGGR